MPTATDRPKPVHDPRGSLWYRWDLHFHTPSSFDYADKRVSNQSIVDRLIDEGVRVVAVTDHHTMDLVRIRDLQRLGGDKLAVLPGIELRCEYGRDPVHYICIFPEDCDLDHVWTRFSGTLKLTAADIATAGGDESIWVGLEEAAKLTHELGGVVSIHAGGKSNSIEGISNKEEFQRRIKFDITKGFVDLMEIGQLKDIDVHLKTIFPATGLDKPLVLCSDNHNISKYAVKAPLWLRADPTFRGLRMVLREPRGRIFIGDRPPEHVRVEQNPTKYIKSVSFKRRPEAKADEIWFSGQIDFNPGLVAIVGDKGSGKSALSDIIGLLGASKNSDTFSFLNKERFRHPIGNPAQHFEATLSWMKGKVVTKRLSEQSDAADVERVKYLPQEHVETVCNELANAGEHSFEDELKAVIFSHVPENKRLGRPSLDKLIEFQTEEKQRRIDSLLRNLRDISRQRAAAEAQADPVHREALEAKIVARTLELQLHDEAKPAAVPDPATQPGAVTVDPEVSQALAGATTTKETLEQQIADLKEKLGKWELRLAIAERLQESLNNFRHDYEQALTSMDQDAKDLGLEARDLLKLEIKPEKVNAVHEAAATEIKAINNQLKAEDPLSAAGKLKAVTVQIVDLQQKLDTPNRAYQAYLAELKTWREKRATIEGDDTLPESLKGLKETLANLSNLPTRVGELRDEQHAIAKDILAEKLSENDVLRGLYQPVQSFIDRHELSGDKIKLEFKAELINEGFSERFLGLIAQNRKGSFMGTGEGQTKAKSLTEVVAWGDQDSVAAFLQSVDQALHEDQRLETPIAVQLKDQVPRGVGVDELYNLLYGLEYVRPRYVLRWQGKELAMLSPGERGTLLLVFYLLIDKNDFPLIIDQPEGNLDNHTVSMVLVDCIREARKNRQVFIVTHNPNLAVVCDADQVVHASRDVEHGNAVTYTTGSLENPAMSKHVTDVLEGTRRAFGIRGDKYVVGD